MSAPDHLWSIEQLAEHMDVSPADIRLLIRKGCPIYLVDHQIRLDPGEVAEWIEASGQTTAELFEEP